MLPLHEALGTLRLGGICEGAKVGFFVVAIVGEGVGDSSMFGFNECLAEWVVKALRAPELAQQHFQMRIWDTVRVRITGPVSVLNDLVDHVPTRLDGHFDAAGRPEAAAACAEKSAACAVARESDDSAMARL